MYILKNTPKTTTKKPQTPKNPLAVNPKSPHPEVEETFAKTDHIRRRKNASVFVQGGPQMKQYFPIYHAAQSYPLIEKA